MFPALFSFISRRAYKTKYLFGFVSKRLSDKNRAENEKAESEKKYKGSLIYSQGSLREYKKDPENYMLARAPYEPIFLKCCKNKDMAKYGCGIVAVYNALHLLHSDKSVSELITYFERRHGFILRASFGVNAKTVESYFKENGYTVTRYEDLKTLEESKTDGVYIVFQWNAKRKLKNGAHFFTVISENGTLKPLNACGNIRKTNNSTACHNASCYTGGANNGSPYRATYNGCSDNSNS